MPVSASSALHHRSILLLAFAFAVMADPVSSVAYAVEAALRALDGDLALLLPTMALVVAIIALVIVNYQQLVARYPKGGGAAAATGEAFGEAWAFVPIGALIVDFVLTIAISASAGASALIAYFSALAPLRLALALGLVVVVGGITWFGHLGPTVLRPDDHRVHRCGGRRAGLRPVRHPDTHRHDHRHRRTPAPAGHRARLPGRHGAGHRRRGTLVGHRPARAARRRRPAPLRPGDPVAHPGHRRHDHARPRSRGAPPADRRAARGDHADRRAGPGRRSSRPLRGIPARHRPAPALRGELVVPGRSGAAQGVGPARVGRQHAGDPAAHAGPHERAPHAVLGRPALHRRGGCRRRRRRGARPAAGPLLRRVGLPELPLRPPRHGGLLTSGPASGLPRPQRVRGHRRRLHPGGEPDTRDGRS